ncbi:MAG TPA: hypothetical protein VM534_00035 [Thermoanaerobaculia bacterium]|nr:hypothetical protein [Thermoanaerobaculia bacterium]
MTKFVSSLPGLLADQTLAITQVIESARPRTETIRTVIENYESGEPPVAAFEIPLGLQHQHQAPRMAAPSTP